MDIKTTMESLSSAETIGSQQLITVRTPHENHQQLILVNFGAENEGGEGATVISSVKDNTTQTETVFGLEDLPVVKEIVRKTIAKTKKLEAEAEAQKAPPPDHGMYRQTNMNGIYTCPLCAKVYRNKMAWQNHLVSHNGAEVFMCGICAQLFTLSSTLKSHLDVHMREEKQMKRQREMMFGSANLKVGGVYLPGDIVPSDDYKSERQGLDSTVANPDLLNHVSHISHDGSAENSEETYVAATEEVSEVATDSLAGGSINIGGNGIGSAMDTGEGDENSQDAAEDGGDGEMGYIYACNICGEQYNVKEECERHLKVHTEGGDPESPAKPESPGKSSSHEETLSLLAGRNSPTLVRSDSMRTKYSGYIYACNVCGRQYTNKSNCKRHMMIHTEDRKLYECEFCYKRFSQKYEVRMHARIHTGEKPYSCAVCGKTFTERGNWRRHTMIHVRPQESSPYRCGICCKGFFHAEKLQVHLQIHSGQRPFVCTVCGRKVKKIGDMYRHLRTHTGEKPYKCQVCGKGFAQNGNLKDHMKVHTGEKPHACELCGKDFARKILLKEHIKNHHKGATLQDLTEAALEEIERQEAAMDGADGTSTMDATVVHQIADRVNIPRIIKATTSGGRTIVIGGPNVPSGDEAQLLQEEQEIEMQEVHTTLTAKELEAAEVLTVVQDGHSTVYTFNGSSELQPLVGDGNQKQIYVTTVPKAEFTEVQNS
ncbi:zinc finger protein 45-like [Mya arenaria]|uniref:zinc finger protein 45-like n=1 Tax=Mya arenaria TaxID=6604 RepID=UPI0022E67149|nr:zinc finger protein 45-like [Mya arenaria]XP_052815986.1 zinc finger protein 45-like [Mya arenaria]